jgi:hypothetical protein
MILNKFRHRSLFHLCKALSLQLLAISLFSCAKTANSNANKSYVALTHVAYGVGPLNLALDGDSLIPAPVAFGNTSGTQGYPYDTTTSRVDFMQLIQGSDILLGGNSAFQQGTHYSIFAYDTLDQRSISLIILQDNPSFRTDTIVNFRFLNFSPGSQIGIKLIYAHDTTIRDTILIKVRDTVVIPLSLFVGYNPNPALYPFIYNAHVGKNQVFAYIDSARPRSIFDSSNFKRLDTLQFDISKSYNIYLQGYFDSTSAQNKLQIKSVQLN